MTDKAPNELFAAAVGGLLNLTPTTHVPLLMVLDTSTMASLLDTIVQFGIRIPQTSTVQFCVPLMKLLPKIVNIAPAYTKFGATDVMFTLLDT
jgi:hypothetical protein